MNYSLNTFDLKPSLHIGLEQKVSECRAICCPDMFRYSVRTYSDLLSECRRFLHYSPKQQKAAVYFTNNKPGKAYHVISVKELEILSGINFFPKMSEEKKTQLLSLPEPKEMKH